MKTKTLAAIAIAGLAAATISTQADAAMITATFTGSVASGVDLIGAFDAVGTDLTGAKAKAVFTFDTSKGAFSAGGGDQKFLGDGAATITVGVTSWIINADFFANPNIDMSPIGNGIVDLEVANDSGNNTLESYISGSLPGSILPTALFSNFSTLDCVTSPRVCGGSLNLFSGAISDQLGLTYDSVEYKVSAVSQTPIPATLPLFLSAIGGLGFAGWRRKHAAAA